ncbi:precorrin-2 C(20)-methyltransferase [Singulisphaera acidiphila]|uniref:Precorrin-2 C20-methyltransferase n=1 Tax=Singulisphaera acidiphila (strain ATCC BAA-1392 / DSM 18658 / VKM B-2454 / MOB10) TaxID=886293 RepID=L0DBG3_SINAD|nr:precorrin-2 C(20)-methyltransferase [Singulisphaera acidiphila]AGA25986.1 precorrin-2 C20-methyltransferase [Singulisphaera acidiphila DSM 18658]
MSFELATVYVVGVGPGETDLLTLRAVKVLERSEVIFHPGPRDDTGFALGVVAPLLRPNQVVRGASLAMRRGPDDGTVGYERVAQLLAHEARQGRTVAFLTEGDPMLFGSGSYVAERLRSVAPDVPVEIVPGVSASSSAAARLGWPLAQKDEILTICPGTYHPDEIGEILDRGGPVCWFKAAAVLPQLVEELRRRGRLDHAALVERVGHPNERIFLDVSDALKVNLSYFSLVLVR